ncbi:unnamed protein product, partial [Ectocarpus sp. 13 AM-2016]
MKFKGGGGTLSVWYKYASAVGPQTTRPREDGAFFPQERSPMANRSFVLCQRWLKNVFPTACSL